MSRRRGRRIGPAFPIPSFLVPGSASSGLLTDLISFWELEDTGWADAHGSNDLTGNGSPTAVAGKVGNCVDLEWDTPQWLSHASNASLQVGDADFTVCAWFNPEANHDAPTIASKAGGFANGEWRISINFVSGFFPRFTIYDGTTTGNSTNLDGTTAVPAGSWYFVVASFTKATGAMAISINDATPDTGSTPYSSGPSTGPFNIGDQNDDATPNNVSFDGLIDQVGFWKRLLTAEEITFLYNGGSGRAYSEF